MGNIPSNIVSGVQATTSAGYQAGSWFGPTTLISLGLAIIMFGIGGGILTDSITVDQSAKSGAVAGLFIAGAFLTILGLTSRGATSVEGEVGVSERFFRIFPDITGSISNWFRITYYFLPYTIFVAGALIDITTSRLQFFPAGITASLAVILNYLVSTAISGPVTDRDLCGIPGLSSLGSQWAPQSALFNITALSYIATFISIKQGIFGINKVWPAWVIYISVALLNAGVLYGTGCFSSVMDFIMKMGLTAGFGTGIGALGAWIASERISLPSDDGTSSASTNSGGKKSPDGGTCLAPNDQDQFVCEAYKNGQLVTSTIVE